MIYYFSGTGNSEWVAKEIASAIGTEAINIIGYDEAVHKEKEDVVGFVCPTYAWLPAESMLEFMKKHKPDDKAYSFLVSTCVSEAGSACKQIKKKYGLNSCYSINMPNNYILSSNVDSDDVIIETVKKAKVQIKNICQDIIERKDAFRVTEGSYAVVKTKIIGPLFNKFARTTDKFYAEDTCIGCGICAKGCPKHTIELKNNKPVWGKECLQCLACIHRCPQHAIQYGDKTKDRGRYYMKDEYIK